MSQLTFVPSVASFPSTRFQGSKLKIVDWIWDNIKDIGFDSFLDAFGGTGSLSYLLKAKGKSVCYNDILKFNYYIGLALIENQGVVLNKDEVEFILYKDPAINYPHFIRDNFRGIYFTDEENEWIDLVITNIERIGDIYKKALAYFALFQSSIIKRPFNLFHRRNLYLRFSDVERQFGNKTTWDAPFEAHFRKFVQEANNAVFSNGKQNRALNSDAFNVQGNFDLVYIDTPYLSLRGNGVDYLDFYHFLEGVVNYVNWNDFIDYETKNLRFKRTKSIWCDRREIYKAFDSLFHKFSSSIIVVSYRSDGIPSVEELSAMLKKHKNSVVEVHRMQYKYVLSQNHSEEILLIGV